MRKNLSLLATVVALATVGLTGCAGASSSTPPVQEATDKTLQDMHISRTFLGKADGYYYSLLCLKSEAYMMVETSGGVSTTRAASYDSECAK